MPLLLLSRRRCRRTLHTGMDLSVHPAWPTFCQHIHVYPRHLLGGGYLPRHVRAPLLRLYVRAGLYLGSVCALVMASYSSSSCPRSLMSCPPPGMGNFVYLSRSLCTACSVVFRHFLRESSSGALLSLAGVLIDSPLNYTASFIGSCLGGSAVAFCT